MYSEPVRRAAMRRAWQTGRPAASGIVELVQERKARSKQAGFLIYVPDYAEPTRPAVFATACGERPIEAFVSAPFRIDYLMTAVLGSQLDQRSAEHTFELQSLLRISYAVLRLNNKKSSDTSKH